MSDTPSDWPAFDRLAKNLPRITENLAEVARVEAALRDQCKLTVAYALHGPARGTVHHRHDVPPMVTRPMRALVGVDDLWTAFSAFLPVIEAWEEENADREITISAAWCPEKGLPVLTVCPSRDILNSLDADLQESYNLPTTGTSQGWQILHRAQQAWLDGSAEAVATIARELEHRLTRLPNPHTTIATFAHGQLRAIVSFGDWSHKLHNVADAVQYAPMLVALRTRLEADRGLLQANGDDLEVRMDMRPAKKTKD